MTEFDVRTTYFLTAPGLGAAIAVEGVHYDEALTVAVRCSATGAIFAGPEMGPEGYVVNLASVPVLTVTDRQPAGPVLPAPREQVIGWLREAAEYNHVVTEDTR